MSYTNLIHSVRHNEDSGFTLLGGEPLDQASSVHKFILEVQAQKLDVVLYTGYELEELSKIQQKCVAAADIVIHGRYKHEFRSVNLLWRGSSNQEILINNPKFKTIDISEKRQMEIHMSDEGRIKIIGYPTDEILSSVASRNGAMESLKITGGQR